MIQWEVRKIYGLTENRLYKIELEQAINKTLQRARDNENKLRNQGVELGRWGSDEDGA